MKITNYKEQDGFNNMHSIKMAAKLQDSEHVQIIHMELNPGDVVKNHKTPVEVSFFVIVGSVDMKIGEEKQKITAGSLVESPKNIVHGFVNNYENPARVLVIKHLKTRGE